MQSSFIFIDHIPERILPLLVALPLGLMVFRSQPVEQLSSSVQYNFALYSHHVIRYNDLSTKTKNGCLEVRSQLLSIVPRHHFRTKLMLDNLEYYILCKDYFDWYNPPGRKKGIEKENLIKEKYYCKN